MTRSIDTDILIVGAGPAGLSAALVLGRQQRRVCLVDAGQPRNQAAQQMHMYLGRNGEDPAELRATARAELAHHDNITIRTGEVESIDGTAGAFVAQCGDQRIGARVVLLAGGVRDRLDDIPGVADRWGRQVAHCVYCHGYESVGARIGVLALTPQNAMLACYLRDRFSTDVTLFAHRIATSTDLLATAAAHDVQIEHRDVTALTGAERPVVQLVDGTEVTVDMVFCQPPTELTNTLATDLGCELTEQGLIAVAPTMATSVAGVFAAGDGAQLREAPAPTQFVTQAAADGQRAAVWIEQQLFAAALNPDS